MQFIHNTNITQITNNEHRETNFSFQSSVVSTGQNLTVHIEQREKFTRS